MGKLSIAIVCTPYRYFGSKCTGVPIPLGSCRTPFHSCPLQPSSGSGGG
jgi:hypothetical protein